MKELIYDFFGYNEYIFVLINTFCHKIGIEQPLFFISKIFDIEKFAIYYILVLLAGFIYIKNKNSKGFFFDFMMKLGTAYASFGFAYAALKFSVNMQRPFCSLASDQFYTIANISEERCLSSFPSSHTGLCFLILLFIWPYLSHFTKALGISALLCVGLSRISLAMHYPADIIYSLLIAYLIYILSRRIYRIFKNNIFAWARNIFIG